MLSFRLYRIIFDNADSLLGVSSPIHHPGVSAKAKGEDGISVLRHSDLCQTKPPGENGECQVSYRWAGGGKVKQGSDKEGEKISKRVGMIRRNVSGSKKSESHL